MVIVLYTDRSCEFQAKYCIESLLPRLAVEDKVVYYTVGFESTLDFKNLHKVPVPYKNYPTFHYYKAELSLKTLTDFPDEKYFCFTDTDVLFSKRLNFKKLEHNLPYPLASLGPHEYPFIWEDIKPYSYRHLENGLIQLDNGRIGTLGDEIIIYNEVPAMNYFNISSRTMQYVWSCFYSFTQNCKDFFEEYTSMCKNQYLLGRREHYYPFHDETSFNICLWKRNATSNLGYAFVNTHSYDVVKATELQSIQARRIGKNIDALGADWEYVHNSEDVIFYHGIKEENTGREILNWLLSI